LCGRRIDRARLFAGGKERAFGGSLRRFR
jgi:hypothetical protein